MLKNIKKNDICIFLKGDRAKVTSVQSFGNGDVKLIFNREVYLNMEDNMTRNNLLYKSDGVPYTCQTPNSIVKVIRC